MFLYCSYVGGRGRERTSWWERVEGSKETKRRCASRFERVIEPGFHYTTSERDNSFLRPLNKIRNASKKSRKHTGSLQRLSSSPVACLGDRRANSCSQSIPTSRVDPRHCTRWMDSQYQRRDNASDACLDNIQYVLPAAPSSFLRELRRASADRTTGGAPYSYEREKDQQTVRDEPGREPK